MRLLKKVLSFCFIFKGRLNRKKFILSFVGLYLVFFLIAISFGVLSALYNKQTDYGKLFSGAALIISVLICIPVFAGAFSIPVRRLHDLNFSGWWYGLAYLFGGATGVVTDERMRALLKISPPDSLVLIVSVLQAAFLIGMIIFFCFIKGTKGPNKYGSDPLEEARPV